MPTLRVLQRNWPETEITWIIGKTELALVKDIPGIEFIVYDKSCGWKALLDLKKALRGRQFELLLNLQASLRASLASLTIKSPYKLGFDRQRARGLQWLFTNNQIATVPHQHVLDSFLEFPKALGLATSEIAWNLPIPDSARVKAKELLTCKQPFMAINPCSSVRAHNFRNWDVTSYAKIIDFASEKYGLNTVLTGGPSAMERDYAEQIVAASTHKPCNLVGRTNLKELLAVLDEAVVAIAPDTGPAHLANAVGTPVIGLYASSNPNRTGPYLNRELTVNCYPQAVYEELGKGVAEVRWGQRVRNPAVMEIIQPEDVQKKLTVALERQAPDA